MKLAMDKCVELSVPTSEYLLHVSDLNEAWDQPAAGDPLKGENNGHVEESSTEYQALLKENLEFRRQLLDNRAEMSSLSMKLSELTWAINTLYIDQVAGMGAPIMSTSYGLFPTTSSNTLTTTTQTLVSSGSTSFYSGAYSTYAVGNGQYM